MYQSHEYYLRRAIEVSKASRAAGNTPFGALLVAVCIYFVLGMKDIRAELALGRARAPGRLFGITARFYVFLTVAVWILGIAYGGIG